MGENVRTDHMRTATSFQNLHEANVAGRQAYNGGFVRGVVRNPRDESGELFNVLILVLATCLRSDSRLRLLLFISRRIQWPFLFCPLAVNII